MLCPTRPTRLTGFIARPLALALGLCFAATAASAEPKDKHERDAYAGRVFFAPAATVDDYDSFIVYYRDDAAPTDATSPKARQMRDLLDADLDRLDRKLGIRAQHTRRLATGGHLITLDQRTLDAAGADRLMIEMAANPELLLIEPNLRMVAAALPNDPLLSAQWGLLEPLGGINVEAAWDLEASGRDVVIAVIDTGSTPHPDLDAKTLPGIDMISQADNARDGNGRDPDPSDTGDWNAPGTCAEGAPGRSSSWHGTHVAGIAAALTHNNQGVSGVAYGSFLQHVRVLGTCGGNLADIADGIVWASGGAVPNLPNNPTPARVLNLSLGGLADCPTTYQNAINTARARGSVLMVAAGNDTLPANFATPANCAGVVTVAAGNRAGGRAVYSNYGPTTDITAPGGDSSNAAADGIVSTINLGATTPGSAGYAMKDGTSMATPFVAGIAALAISRNPSLTPDQVEALLRNTARPFPTFCSGGCGTGIVDAAALIRAVDGEAITRYPVSVALYGNGQGTITSASGGINCGALGANCSTRFNANSNVTLTATAAAGTAFAGWFGGSCSGTTPTCTLAMNRAHDVYAAFDMETPSLTNGVAVTNLGSTSSTPLYFQLQVPAGATDLRFRISGGTGDADLYVRKGTVPDLNTFDCRPFLLGNSEECTFPAPEAGTWHVMLTGDPDFNGVTLRADYTTAGADTGIFCSGMEAVARTCTR